MLSDNIPAERPILKAMVDSQCTFARDQDNEDYPENTALETQLPCGFLLPVMNQYRHMVGEKFKALRPCDYHEHSEEERKQCKQEAERE